MEHGQDGRDADAGGHEQHRAGAVGQHELAARRGDVEDGAGPQPGGHVRADDAVRFALDADPVGVGAGARRERVAAHRCRIAGSGRAQGDVLPGESRRQGAVVGGQVHRRHRRGLRHELGDAQPAEAGPARLHADGRRGDPGSVLGAVEQLAERLLPARAERGDVDRGAEPLDVAAGQVEQRVDVGDAERVPADPGAHDLVAGPDLPFDDHTQVEARAVVGDEQGRHSRLAEPHADPEAGDPRLGDLELGVTDAVAVADADLVVAEPFDGEVLAELAELEVVPAEVLLPVAIGLDLVDEHCPLLAAVPVEVALTVAVDVEPAHHPRPVDRPLPDAGVHGVALPADVLRQADVHRQQARHPPLLSLGSRSGSHARCLVAPANDPGRRTGARSGTGPAGPPGSRHRQRRVPRPRSVGGSGCVGLRTVRGTRSTRGRTGPPAARRPGPAR